MRQKILFIVSILFGLIMVNAGLNKFFNYMPVPDDLPETVMQVMSGFMKIGWLFPLIATIEIIGGVLFAIPKYRALGAIVIFPIVVGIVLFHLFQAPDGIFLASVVLGIDVWAIVENRNKYLPMLR